MDSLIKKWTVGLEDKINTEHIYNLLEKVIDGYQGELFHYLRATREFNDIHRLYGVVAEKNMYPILVWDIAEFLEHEIVDDEGDRL